MITITFKNVGQGDSIILEWQYEGKNLIGIIDCKKDGESNPVLEYIVEKGYERIEFLLLSHPHLDHCSGFLDLIQHCLDHNVILGHFLHTGSNTTKYWKGSADSAFGSDYLLNLYTLLAQIAGKKITVNNIEGETMNPHYIFYPNLFMQIMAPTHTEFHKWFNDEYPGYSEEELGNKPSVNFLSTVVKIYANDWDVLLTADVDKTTLIYYDKRKPDHLKGRLILAQSPHHGSGANHNNTFWKNRLNKNQKTVMVFSVGKNGYGHPAKNAVDFFSENGFDLYSTNEVGALSKTTSVSRESSDAADPFGGILSIKKDRFNGDKAFQIDLAGTVTLV